VGLSTSGAYLSGSYTNFDFGSTWFISSGNTRPLLRAEYSTTITNAHQLQLMVMDLTANYTVANAIDMSELARASGVWNVSTGFMPVGNPSSGLFTGNFNGRANPIIGLTINRPTEDNVGL